MADFLWPPPVDKAHGNSHSSIWFYSHCLFPTSLRFILGKNFSPCLFPFGYSHELVLCLGYFDRTFRKPKKSCVYHAGYETGKKLFFWRLRKAELLCGYLHNVGARKTLNVERNPNGRLWFYRDLPEYSLQSNYGRINSITRVRSVRIGFRYSF